MSFKGAVLFNNPPVCGEFW